MNIYNKWGTQSVSHKGDKKNDKYSDYKLINWGTGNENM
jgi:hypothetical protein